VHRPSYDCTLLSLFHLIFTVASLSHIIILFKFILSSFQRLGAEMHRKASSSMMLRLILRGLQLSKMWQIIVKISSSALTVIYLCLHFSFACFFNDNHSLSHHFKFHWNTRCSVDKLYKDHSWCFMENVTMILNVLHYTFQTCNIPVLFFRIL
jgi:hypothetical protein